MTFGTKPVILDGATGSALQARGMPAGVCPETWILEHPDVLISLQKEYIDAGSNIVYAPTFGANSPALARNGITGQTARINKELTKLSQTAACGRALVCGDLAPTGLSIAPYGSTSFSEVVAVYAEQIQALDEAGVDLFTIETSMSLIEARCAMIALRETSKKPFIASFTVSPAGTSLFGDDLRCALITAQALGASSFGINCCDDFQLISQLLAKLSPYAKIPLLVKPNAGIPEMIDGRAHYKLSPESFAAFAPELTKFGVGLFGGCCGTTPEHIRALKNAVSDLDVAAPVCNAEILCASPKILLQYSADMQATEIICSDNLLDDAAEAKSSGAKLLKLIISDEEALSSFIEFGPMLQLPICLCCETEALLEQAAREYCGIALCETRSEFTEQLSKKYGLQLI